MRKVFSSRYGEQTFELMDSTSEPLQTNNPVAYELPRVDSVEDGDQFEIKCDTPDVIDFGDSLIVTPEMTELVFLAESGFSRAGSFLLTVVKFHNDEPPIEVHSMEIEVIESEKEEDLVISALPATPDIMEDMGMWDIDLEDVASDARQEEAQEDLVPIPEVPEVSTSSKESTVTHSDQVHETEQDLSDGYAEPFPDLLDGEPETDEVENSSASETKEDDIPDLPENVPQRPEIGQDVQEVVSRLNPEDVDAAFMSDPNPDMDELEEPQTISETDVSSAVYIVDEDEPSQQRADMTISDLEPVQHEQGGDTIHTNESRNDRVDNFESTEDRLSDEDQQEETNWFKRNWIFLAVSIPALLLVGWLVYMPFSAIDQMEDQAALSAKTAKPASSTTAGNGTVIANPVCTSNCSTGNINNGVGGSSAGTNTSSTNNAATGVSPQSAGTNSGSSKAGQTQSWREWSGTPSD